MGRAVTEAAACRRPHEPVYIGLGRLSTLLDPMAADARAMSAAIECVLDLTELRQADLQGAGPLGRLACA